MDTTGISALRRAILSTTCVRERPNARAARTKSESRDSIMAARVMRVIGASGRMPNVTAGSTR